MKVWAGLWVEVTGLLAAKPLKEMIGTWRLFGISTDKPT